MKLKIERPELCVCNHPKDYHTHYTRGIYCSKCACNRYKRMIWLLVRWRSQSVD